MDNGYNPLDQMPGLREKLYLLQWGVNGVLGAIAVVLVILAVSPLWFIIVSAVFNFAWSYLGLTAKRNVFPPSDPLVDDQLKLFEE